jgi:lipopolysaccharide export system ATP-binding protein
LTVEQNIAAILEMLGFSWSQRRKRTDELLEQFSITHIRKSKAAKLSGGERRRLEIARCLVSNPKIIMLDEPYAGIDPVTVQSIQQIIFRLRDSGISILITDHAAMEILSTVDRCYVISKGVVLKEGTPEEVKQHPEVRKQYLGNLQDHAAIPAHVGSFVTGQSQDVPLASGERQLVRSGPHTAVPEPAMQRTALRRRSETARDRME